MSNMNANFTLISEGDRRKLQVLRQALKQNPEIECIYVHHSHVCTTASHPYLNQERVKLIVYSDIFYADLLAMVVAKNKRIYREYHHVDENVVLDNTPALIGYCICNQETQPKLQQPVMNYD